MAKKISPVTHITLMLMLAVGAIFGLILLLQLFSNNQIRLQRNQQPALPPPLPGTQPLFVGTRVLTRINQTGIAPFNRQPGSKCFIASRDLVCIPKGSVTFPAGFIKFRENRYDAYLTTMEEVKKVVALPNFNQLSREIQSLWYDTINNVIATIRIAYDFEIVARYRGGNCNEMAVLAAAFLFDEPIYIATLYPKYSKENHTFLLLAEENHFPGGYLAKDLREIDPTLWKKIFILDPWYPEMGVFSLFEAFRNPQKYSLYTQIKELEGNIGFVKLQRNLFVDNRLYDHIPDENIQKMQRWHEETATKVTRLLTEITDSEKPKTSPTLSP